MNPREDPLFQSVAREMETHLGDDSTGHDMHHLWRVCRLGVRIAEAEGADVDVVGAAALTHDLHRVRGANDEFVHPEETLPEVTDILRDAGFPEDKLDETLHCVAVHEEYDFEAAPDEAETLEAEIVQDADNLDAIGAVGVARAFAFGGVHGNLLWDPERELPDGDDHYDKSGSDDHDGPGSTLHHFHSKLLRLRDAMNTETGRELAEPRHEFLEDYLERFEAEWMGDA